MSGRTTTAATLFNLKDEYLKAKQEKLGLNDVQQENKRKKLKQIINYKHAEKSKKESEKREKERKRAARLALTDQESEDLRKSRSILEAKSAIYDKLSNNKSEEHSDNLLVDFSQKSDRLGISYDYNNPVQSSSSHKYHDDDVNMGPTEVHFSNVDHGEVRSKGVGFYSFSEDPLTRNQQMEFLDSMRESTEKSRELFLAGKKKRKQEKLHRLNRIRKKHGLPFLDKLPNEKEDVDEAEPAPQKEDEPSKDQGYVENITDKFLKREQTLWEKKVEELRNDRESEFAPVYHNTETIPGHGGYVGYHGNNEEDIDEESDEIVNFISFVRRTTI